ncbi:MAG: sporulation protein YqfD, partial [Oscillospiraceae bacterium]|nr:sporulation protein YqfD [Oscillospiraceae bacterium]
MRVYELFNRTAGWTLCAVTGAEPAAFLNECTNRGIELLSALPAGQFRLLARLRSRDLARAKAAAGRVQCAVEVLSSGGAPRLGRLLLRRTLAAAGLLAAFFLLVWSRFYIWDIEVTGNETVPTARILDALRECGVTSGTFWPAITSDNLRSELLVELPELSWATVNIYGSRAEVLVRERVPKPELWDRDAPVDLVAEKAGFITAVDALSGTAAVRPGSAVLPGEVLISSAADSAWSGPRRVHAAGRVTAETYRCLTAETPLTTLKKRYTGETRSRWALISGKMRWNFYGNSSISRGDCDRITSTWDLSLGGVFALPLSL